MSTYIDLGKEPRDSEERKELISKYIRKIDERELISLNVIQQRVFDFLTSEKGYPKETIIANKIFKILLPNTSFVVTSDLLILLDDTFAMTIKCAMNSIESWERYSLAFGRTAMDTTQIPFAMITDSEDYILINVLTGQNIGRGKDIVPSFAEMKEFIKTFEPIPYLKEKSEREKRILHAFAGLRCSSDSCEDTNI